MRVPRFIYLFFNLFRSPLGQIAYEAYCEADKPFRKLHRFYRKQYNSMARAAIRAKREGGVPARATYNDLWQGNDIAWCPTIEQSHVALSEAVLAEAEKRNLL